MFESEIQFVEGLAGCRVIPLSKGQFAAVDLEDFAWLSQWKWHHMKKGYAARDSKVSEGVGKSKIFMHSIIITGATCVDHRDGDRLNNRRFNLRPATNAENLRNRVRPRSNTSGFKGVSWNKRAKKWHAYIMANYKRIHLGLFDDPKDAHDAYAHAAKELHGEFHRIN